MSRLTVMLAVVGIPASWKNRFAPDKEDVADVVADGDINGVARLLQGHALTIGEIELGACEAAELAVCVAEVGDGELQIAGAAGIENFTDEFEEAFVWAFDRRSWCLAWVGEL